MGKNHILTSVGLWRKRHEIQQLFPEDSFSHPISAYYKKAEVYSGWGNKASGLRAQSLAKANDASFNILEDGFLRSFAPGNDEPSASFVIDTKGAHYDPRQPSNLEALIANGISDANLLLRSRSAMNELRARQLSKYNNSPALNLKQLGLSQVGAGSKPYVLLLDQVPNDAAVIASGANFDTYQRMLRDACEEWPNHAIVIRTHPAAGRVGNLAQASVNFDNAMVLEQRANVWPLLEGADHVYVISSLSGFEALMCDKPVTCYGQPFYSGWGLTRDKNPCSRRNVSRSIEEVFACAYIKYTHYLDFHSRKLTTLENIIDDLAIIRDARAKNRRFVASVGMSPWKRKAIDPFLVGEGGAARHFKTGEQACAAMENPAQSDLVIWGADQEIAQPNTKEFTDKGGYRIIRLEDGFLRSVGLGAALNFPISLVRDSSRHLYFDARGKGTLEQIINTTVMDETCLERARALHDLIIKHQLTKYMLRGKQSQLPHVNDRMKVLVTGQVSDDASIRFGAPGIKTNVELIETVRAIYPDCFLVYREHPDVESGLRAGKVDKALADFDGNKVSLTELFDWCDRVETISSLSGFEALLRGKPVGVHGWPFYAGWGLTEDRLKNPARGKINIETLIAAALILYPDYIHPVSGLPCSAERAIMGLVNERENAANHPFVSNLYQSASIAFARIIRLFK